MQFIDSQLLFSGIRENQLPPYIYQMRLLGYPPGHMLDAQIDESGISMFDKHGKGKFCVVIS